MKWCVVCQDDDVYSEVRTSAQLQQDQDRPLSQKSENAYADIDSYLAQQ